MSLSLSELRTFVMLVFSHRTLCRFSCASYIKLDDLLYNTEYFEVKISFSKTDQIGSGEIVVLPYKSGRRNPHMLMCLYIEAVSAFGQECMNTTYLFPPLK